MGSYGSTSIVFLFIALLSLLLFGLAVWFFSVLGLLLAGVGKTVEQHSMTSGWSFSYIAFRLHAGLLIILLLVVVLY